MSEGQSKAHTIRELLKLTQAFFDQKGIGSPRLDAELLLAHALHEDRLKLYLDLDRPLDEDEVTAFRELVRRRGRREPVAYILGGREFYGIPFVVSPSVLVPRPDTETLVDLALERLPEDAAGEVVDVGTGSGCIAVALAEHRAGLTLLATERSAAALDVARQNVAARGLGDRVLLLEGDLLGPVEDRSGLLAVVGNPPYIRRQSEPELMPEVREHEPEAALYGEDEDGLGHHRRILAGAGALLAPGGFVLLEIGHDQGTSVRTLGGPGLVFREVFADLAGSPRVALWVKSS